MKMKNLATVRRAVPRMHLHLLSMSPRQMQPVQRPMGDAIRAILQLSNVISTNVLLKWTMGTDLWCTSSS